MAYFLAITTHVPVTRLDEWPLIPQKIMAHSLQPLLCQSSHEHGDERGGGGGGGQCGKKYTFMPPATMRTPVIPIGGLYADCSAAMLKG